LFKIYKMIIEKSKNDTLKKYLKQEAKSDEKYEFINKNKIKRPLINGSCNIIAANLMALIAQKTEHLQSTYILFSPKQKIYFPQLDEVVYSNLSIVCERPIYWDNEQLLLINPIIVVEVLSENTQQYDQTGKFDKYKTLESIRDYVLIRQNECYAEVWHQEKPGLWRETIIKDIEHLLPLKSVGVELSMQRIYKNVKI
jgi:Uma2 family endonuclease